METKDTLSSCSYSDEQDMQKMLKQAKILKGGCLNGLSTLKSNFTRILEQGITKSEFERAFSHIFGENVDTFTRTLYAQNNHSCNKRFRKVGMTNKWQDSEWHSSIEKSIDERAKHKQEYNSWVNDRQMQTTEDKVDSRKALDASLVDTESSGTALKEQDTSSRSGNDAHADDADIRPIYDEEPTAKVQTIAEINIFATGQQHTEQPKLTNDGEVDQNAEQCHDTCPLPAKLTDNQTTEISNQSLESKNISLKEGQHGQFLNVKSNEAKAKHDIDVIETINIELEHKVAKLLKENETLKSSKLQEKGFAIAALKNELRKLTGNSVNIKFAKSSILEKPALQPRRNQSVIRQTTAFKSERPRISKPRFASQVDVNNDLSKPVTTHYLPKERESAVAKPQHMIAHGSSRWKPTGNIFKAVGRKWISWMVKISPCTTKVDSEPTNGSNDDITNKYECEQILDSETRNLRHSMKLVKFKDGSKSCSSAEQTATPRQELGITNFSSHNNFEGRMPTKIELTLEQSQQGVSNDVLVSIEGVEE
ncbi:hypothetical protein Tco_0333257 [Tanacetum coccineum]